MTSRMFVWLRACAGAAVVALATGLAGCGTQVGMSGGWSATDRAGAPFSDVLVVGISPNSRVRRSFELALADAIASDRVQAHASVQTPESQPQLTREIVASMVSATGADAVIVTRLISRKVAASESAGRTGVKTRQPTSLNGGVGLVELFSLQYNEYEEPGELSARSSAIIETTVYETRVRGDLVYALTTTAAFTENRDDVVGDVARAIARRLRQDGVIR